VPFKFADDVDASGNGFDELLIAELESQIKAIVEKVVDDALHIKQPSGVKVCRLTGRIVD